MDYTQKKREEYIRWCAVQQQGTILPTFEEWIENNR